MPIVRMLFWPSLIALLLLTGCSPVTQRSGALEIRLIKADAPGGANVAPPAGTDLFRAGLDVTNTSGSTQTVAYQAGELLLYDGQVLVPARGGTSSTASDARHQGTVSNVHALPAGGDVSVFRDFLVKPGQRNLRLVYRLPGYPDHTWNVR